MVLNHRQSAVLALLFGCTLLGGCTLTLNQTSKGKSHDTEEEIRTDNGGLSPSSKLDSALLRLLKIPLN